MRQAAGFTLMEMLAVVVIVGLLASLGGVYVHRAAQDGQRDIAFVKCKELYDRVHYWRLRQHRFPTDWEELEAPMGPGEPAYLRPENDPWGSPYALEVEEADVCVRSFGQDRRERTEDDLRYPPGER